VKLFKIQHDLNCYYIPFIRHVGKTAKLQ